MAGKWSKIAMESCASWESTRATAHFARKMVEKWRHIREETKRKMALLKRKTRFRQCESALPFPESRLGLSADNHRQRKGQSAQER